MFAPEADWIEALRLPDVEGRAVAEVVDGRWLAGHSELKWNVYCFEAGEKLWRWTWTWKW